MVQVAGPSPRFDPRSGGSTGALQRQLEEVERQLSDCVNCDSSKTTEGKARIQRLEARAQALKARLDTLAVAKGSQSPQGPSATPSDDPGSEAVALAAVPPAVTYAPNGALPSRPGSRLDVTR